MLKATGILNADDSDQIIAGLEGIQTDLEAGKLNFTVENEDIHMNIEAILTDRIGAVAGKLHTGRSRNDQVATDFHLYLKKRLPKIIDELTTIQKKHWSRWPQKTSRPLCQGTRIYNTHNPSHMGII